jgi:predicted permease
VDDAKLTSTLVTLKSRTVGDVAQSLWILLASVGLVLLVACANVANLFLVRSEARQREIAVREALGAGRRGVRRFFLSESLLLALCGAVIGIGIAYAAVKLLVAYGPATLPRLDEVRVDYVVIAFTVTLAFLSSLLFGTYPLIRHRNLSPALQETGRGNTVSRSRNRLRHLLMGTQMALACVLVIGAGLMVRSFQALRDVDPNFDAESALTFRVGLPSAEYETREAAILAHTQILDALSALPGVRSVSATTCMPLDAQGFCHGDPLLVEGRDTPPGTIPPIVAYRGVAGDWFETIGTPIVRGRGIDRADVQGDLLIAVVNERLVDLYFPGEEVIGRRVAIPVPGREDVWFTIVGIVENTPTFTLTDASASPKMYVAWQSQHSVGPGMHTMSYVVRTAASPLASVSSIRAAVARVDSNLPLAQLRTLQDVLDRASAQTAFTMALIVLAAGVALVLGIIGIYGVVSYVVSQRAGEIGVRLALGAEPGRVARMILRQGSVVAFAGLGIGLVTALFVSRSVSAILYGVSPTDPLVYALATISLLAVALLACWLPARRAARLSPIEALRPE